jgi:hypothetical protein
MCNLHDAWKLCQGGGGGGVPPQQQLLLPQLQQLQQHLRPNMLALLQQTRMLQEPTS